MAQAVITYGESYVNTLISERDEAKAEIVRLLNERGESENWNALADARKAAREAHQKSVEIAAELERERQKQAPTQRDFADLRRHNDALEEKVAEQALRISELEAEAEPEPAH